jgi:hypothetical protein
MAGLIPANTAVPTVLPFFTNLAAIGLGEVLLSLVFHGLLRFFSFHAALKIAAAVLATKPVKQLQVESGARRLI